MSALAGSAILSSIGSLGNSAMTYSNAEQNRSFQRSMDSTKYQRSVADMNAAGLNPMLAMGNVNGGGGTGSPMGTLENPISSALSAKKLSAETDNIKAQTEYVRNKKDITEPISIMMDLLAKFIEKPTQDIKDTAGPLYSRIKNKMRTSAKDTKEVDIWERIKSGPLSKMINKVFSKHRNYKGK